MTDRTISTLANLTLAEGDPVSAFGLVELDESSNVVSLWPLHPWIPTRQGWTARGRLDVSTSAPLSGLTDGMLVRADGRWVGGRIDAARIEAVNRATLAMCGGRTDRLAFRDSSLEAFAELGGAVEETSAFVISSGAGEPDDTAWFYVLYVTNDLVELIERTALRVSLHVAVTPNKRGHQLGTA